MWYWGLQNIVKTEEQYFKKFANSVRILWTILCYFTQVWGVKRNLSIQTRYTSCLSWGFFLYFEFQFNYRLSAYSSSYNILSDNRSSDISFGTSINFSSIKRVRAPIFQAGMSKYRVDWCSIKHYFGTSINFLTINHVRALIFQASTSQHRAHELLDAQFNTIRYRWYRSEKSYFYRPDLINLIWSFTRSQNQSVSPIMEVLISAILIGCKIG